jgi:hypothetical protein
MGEKRRFLGFKSGPSLLDEVEQLQLGRAENVGFEPLPNDLAPDFDPCIIRAAADVLQQVRNLRERAPRPVFRNSGSAFPGLATVLKS